MRAIFLWPQSAAIRLASLVAALVLAGCGTTTVAERPCPRVSEFSPALQRQAAEELTTLPPGSALERMLDAVAADRAYNLQICRDRN